MRVKRRSDMKLSDQVCSLELAKRLKELGVKQESLFYWFESLFKGKESFIRQGDTSYRDGYELACSAFTVAELGKLLPDKISPENQFDCYILFTMKNTSDGEWVVRYAITSTIYCAIVADTEADARAKMLIYLIENKLIEVN